MKVSELIAKLNELPQDYVVSVASGGVAAIWVSEEQRAVDIDYGNTWHDTENGDESFKKRWDAHPELVITG